MSEPESKFWFPAKRYGWGWGLPSRWQGWAVLVGYLVMMAAGVFALVQSANTLAFELYVALLSLGFVAICRWKGEPPRWRWGNSDDSTDQ